jgi:hypothetical protein
MSRPAVTVCPRVIAVQCLQGDGVNEGNLSLGSHLFLFEVRPIMSYVRVLDCGLSKA